MILDLIGSAAVGLTLACLLVAVASTVFSSLTSRLIFAGVVGAWVASAAWIVTHAGRNGVLIVGGLGAAVFVAIGLLVFTSATAREKLLAIPIGLIVQLNALRVIGVLFLLLVAAGRLAGPFPWSAGVGDVLTGLLAMQAARNGRLLEWNVFGALDLLAALALGVLSNQRLSISTHPRGCRIGGDRLAAVGVDPRRSGTAVPHRACADLRSHAPGTSDPAGVPGRVDG